MIVQIRWEPYIVHPHRYTAYNPLIYLYFPRAQNGKLLDTGTMRELGVIPGSIIYLEYNHALIQEAEVFTSSTEQGFKGTVLSGL